MPSYYGRWLSSCPTWGGTEGFVRPFPQKDSGLSTAQCPQPLTGTSAASDRIDTETSATQKMNPKHHTEWVTFRFTARVKGTPGCPALPSVSWGFEEFGGFPHSCSQGSHGARAQRPTWARSEGGRGGLWTFRLTGRSHTRVKTGGTEQAPYSVVLGMAHSAANCPSESERLSLAIYILVGGRNGPPPPPPPPVV